MNFLIGLVIGLIVGWLAEWLIDWRYWRRKKDDFAEETKLRTQLSAAEREITKLQLNVQELSRQSAQAGIQKPDRLETIHGIGIVFAKRFNRAGVFTFADLAALSPQQAREIVSVANWQAIDPESWLAEAKLLASEDVKSMVSNP